MPTKTKTNDTIKKDIKKRNKSKTKTKSKSKTRTKSRTKSRSRSKSRTRTKSKSKSKTRTKSRTKSRSRSISQQKYQTFLQQKPDYITYQDENYHFEYCPTQYYLKPTPYLEVLRHQKWSQLVSNVYQTLRQNQIQLISGKKRLNEIVSTNLAMWVAINLMDKTALIDPLVPFEADTIDTFITTIHHLGHVPMEKASRVFKEMDIVNRANKIVLQLAKYQRKPTHKFGKVIQSGDKLIYINKREKLRKEVHCSSKVYHRLLERYNDVIKTDKPPFRDLVFCLLLRYETLAGNSHQFAMEPDFKDILTANYNIDFECFASAINVHYGKFCSLFYDIEQYFGSYGSFYNMKYHRGFYIANPPYETILLKKMVMKFIESCQESKEPLSISYGLPNWGKYDVFEALEITKKSKLVKYFRCMKYGEVFWYDRLNNKKIKIPSHCRSVVQNKKGEKKYDMSQFDKLVNQYWVSD